MFSAKMMIMMSSDVDTAGPEAPDLVFVDTQTNAPARMRFVDSKFLGTGYPLSSKLAYSSNGANWVDSGVSMDVVPASDGGTFVGFNMEMTDLGGVARDRVFPYTSPDGINWTRQSSIPLNSTDGWYSVGTTTNAHAVPGAQPVSYLNGKFFGFVGSAFHSAKNTSVFYSLDGQNWQAGAISGLVFVDQWNGATARADLCEIRGVASSGSMSVAVGRGLFGNLTTSPITTNKCIRSADQANWVGTTLPFSALWNDIAYGQGKFIAVCNGGFAVSSVDGLNWSQFRMPSTLNWTSITFGDGVWLAVGGPSAVAAVSADGLTWKKITLPVSATWSSATYGNGKFFMTSTAGDVLFCPYP